MNFNMNAAAERLEMHSMPEPNSGCLLWCSSVTPNGYGKLDLKGKTYNAHRVAWTVGKGRIPRGLQVLHHCDVRSCINLEHLYLGTQKRNIRDCKVRGRLNTAKGESHCRAKLTPAQVIAIRADVRPQSAIARDYGIVQAAVSFIKTRRNWKHLE